MLGYIDCKTKFVEQPSTLATLKIRKGHGRYAQGHAVSSQEKKVSEGSRVKRSVYGVNNASLSFLHVTVSDHC